MLEEKKGILNQRSFYKVHSTRGKSVDFLMTGEKVWTWGKKINYKKIDLV